MKSRIRSLAVGSVLAFCCVFAATSAAFAKPKPPAKPKPGNNIIVVMTDDQTLSDMQVMSKTNALIGGGGATFNNYFVSFSLCCPSRATYLSGQYSHNNGVLGNELLGGDEGGYQALRNRRNLLPAWLARAGYRTGHVGKYLNQYGTSRGGKWNSARSIPPGWTDWMGAPGPSAYRMYDYRLNLNGRLKSYGSLSSDYQTDVYGRLALDFIRRYQRQKFFLSIAPLAPHTEIDYTPPRAAPRHELVEVPELTQGPSFNEPDTSDKPEWLQSVPELGSVRLAELAELYRARLRSLLAVDDLVEAVYQRLAEYGLLEKTYIVFTSDNGFLFGEHRLVTKNWHFQEATHVPLLVKGPGIAPGSQIDSLAANVDLAPTIAQMAKVKPGLPQDGVSLMPLLTGSSESVREDFLLESFEGHNTLEDGFLELFGTGTHRGIRTLRYSYIEYFDGSHELYDNVEDPFQLNNIYDPEATGELASLQNVFDARLRELANCSGAACL